MCVCAHTYTCALYSYFLVIIHGPEILLKQNHGFQLHLATKLTEKEEVCTSKLIVFITITHLHKVDILGFNSVR